MRRCLNKYFFHKWGKWKKYQWNIVGKDGLVKAIEIRQERFCDRCNKCEDECISVIYV